MGKHALKTRIWKLTEINAGWGRGERQRGKKKRIERWGSRSAEEIVLAWWPEAFRLSGCHYLSVLSVRSCVLVLRRRGRIHIDAQPDSTMNGGPDACIHSPPLFVSGWCVFNHRHDFMYLAVCLFILMLQICSAGRWTTAALKQDIFHRQQANCVMHDGKDER